MKILVSGRRLRQRISTYHIEVLIPPEFSLRGFLLSVEGAFGLGFFAISTVDVPVAFVRQANAHANAYDGGRHS